MNQVLFRPGSTLDPLVNLPLGGEVCTNEGWSRWMGGPSAGKVKVKD